MKVVQQFQFLSSPKASFPNKQFYTSKQCIIVTQEGTDDSLLVLAEAPVPAAAESPQKSRNCFFCIPDNDRDVEKLV